MRLVIKYLRPAHSSVSPPTAADTRVATRHTDSVEFAFNSSAFRPGLTKKRELQQEHYSTRTVNATSEYSQQGWCGLC